MVRRNERHSVPSAARTGCGDHAEWALLIPKNAKLGMPHRPPFRVSYSEMGAGRVPPNCRELRNRDMRGRALMLGIVTLVAIAGCNKHGDPAASADEHHEEDEAHVTVRTEPASKLGLACR